MKKEILAYIAGLFDGEGSIYISLRNNRPKSRSPEYSLRVSFVNTNEEVVHLIKDNFGGSILSRFREPDKKRKLTWDWAVSYIKAKDFLKAVYPYLIIKKKQAELGIKFQEQSVRIRNNRKRLTLKELTRREFYKKEISKLNQGVDIK